MKLTQKAQGALIPQTYGKKPQIEGVKIVQIKRFLTEDGAFSEVLRLNNGRVNQPGELKNFQVAQVNYSLVVPGSVKAWHLHLKQDEFWFIQPEGCLLVGLLDVREDSSTKGVSMRQVMGRGQTNLLYVPRGVAHGMANPYQKGAVVVYFTNNQFDGTDEKRLPLDFGVEKDFWEVKER